MVGNGRLVSTPQAIFFDLDGTIVDSKKDIHLALDEVLIKYNRPMTLEEHQKSIGKNWEDVYILLSKRAPLPVPLSVFERDMFETRMHNLSHNAVTEIPGASSVVRRVSTKLPCALVTGSSRKEAELILQHLGIMACFRFLVCTGDVARGKPHPDPYLLAVHHMGFQAQTCVALEDSQVGISAARAAGLKCIAVRAGNFAHQDQSHATCIVDTLQDAESLLFPEAC